MKTFTGKPFNVNMSTRDYSDLIFTDTLHTACCRRSVSGEQREGKRRRSPPRISARCSNKAARANSVACQQMQAIKLSQNCGLSCKFLDPVLPPMEVASKTKVVRM